VIAIGPETTAENPMDRLRSSRQAGTVRLAAPASYARHVLGPALASFRAQYPRIEVDLLVVDDGADIVHGDADIALCVGRGPDLPTGAHRIGTARMALYASAAYLARRQMPRHPSELHAHDCLTCDAIQPRRHWALRHALTGEACDAAVNSVLHSNSIDAVASAAIHGAGIVMLPDLLAGDLVWEAQLQPVLGGWQAEPLSVHLACIARPQLARVRKLMDHLLEAIDAADAEITLPAPAARIPLPLRAVEALA
jgi:DNA-binding transcriptional LysR family regulator